MKTAVILSTYNAPDRLRPTLVGYAAQTHRDFELIVADDGSTGATRELIKDVSSQFSLPIKHVWHEDQGFRKCRILNQAIASTGADYLIFSDGDCIPRADFVATHLERARPGRFLSGGYFKLSAKASSRITAEDILAGHALDPQWLIANGMPRSRKLGRLACSPWRAGLMNAITPTRPTWNGHNASGWRSDMIRINGFDERMAYWAQDREFGERLENSGVRGLQIRYSAICVHLHHERPYKTKESRERNQQIRRDTRRMRARWTVHGIHKSPAPESDALMITPADDVTVMRYA
ncbi:glycosyltransferase family 2 protein [Steroidobacter sp. S1-65]|uniref:Glycosyltransferase family 2 protein n=1 Tax=Steroidobacter gossypii TaxID=2805490 RepID=A0ABS1X4K5_9GAMM|nr:glycosyltransferase family 2 protein [Steroidobacter gossypii]MBM0108158.1 glycosyltransferase family 2 protein [Steroidobacter gossypii]